jgi:hypothetical protein
MLEKLITRIHCREIERDLCKSEEERWKSLLNPLLFITLSARGIFRPDVVKCIASKLRCDGFNL